MPRWIIQAMQTGTNLFIFILALVIFFTRKKTARRKQRKRLVILMSFLLLTSILGAWVNRIHTVTFSSIEEAAEYAYQHDAQQVLLGTDSCFVVYPTSDGTEIVIYVQGENGVVRKADSEFNRDLMAEENFFVGWAGVERGKGSADQYVYVFGNGYEDLTVWDREGTKFSVWTEETELGERHITYLSAVGLLDMDRPGLYLMEVRGAENVSTFTVQRQADGSFVQVK